MPAHYFDESDLVAFLPQAYITQALTDVAEDGSASVFEAVRRHIENRLNGELASRFTVPIDAGAHAGLAAWLRYACGTLAAGQLYIRRGEDMPKDLKTEIGNIAKRLGNIIAGEDPLSAEVEPEQDTVQAITETSRVVGKAISF